MSEVDAPVVLHAGGQTWLVQYLRREGVSNGGEQYAGGEHGMIQWRGGGNQHTRGGHKWVVQYLRREGFSNGGKQWAGGGRP
jgi:hypothetical protein